MTLTDFLLARIAEREAAARDLPGPHWLRAVEMDGSPGHWRGVKAELVTLPHDDPFELESVPGPTVIRGERKDVRVLDHVALNDPARVLAECAAMRGIVERHARKGVVEPWMDESFVESLGLEDDRDHAWCSWCTYDDRTVPYPCSDLEDLAAIWADHSDYRQEWRP